ncbi:LIM and SH3 domain protein Lasp [Phlebotomus argentipes]|uniref:LIM and SH3 domain protein Lasp n=1 Tax=Phlebotomus argentipes TaxID=94469 RepID=UPI002893448A|nr:LIM and SH3 domain protein Lasp [Phlebotomus argentipes]
MASKEPKKCKRCDKDVFHMELLKAERAFWHRACFKCAECDKQLRMDTYQSHEGVLYCKPHFRALFEPRPVKEAPENAQPRKLEVIVRENQPAELPPDVVRSSDKPSLGLEDLQTVNLRARYQMFEKGGPEKAQRSDAPPPTKAAVNARIANLETGKGASEDGEGESSEEEGGGGNFTERLGVREMRDIRRRFEDGHMAREERREERKQEIQNIRSRLFMGKQARIKEMYQQAVAESEATTTAQAKDVTVCQEARNIRERFERGEVFAQRQAPSGDDVSELVQHGLAKASRSIFQELDTGGPPPPQRPVQRSASQLVTPPADVRSDSHQDSVKVETAEIGSRFRFFETYQPKEHQRREFRITPPREGVVRMPSPEKPEYAEWPRVELDDEARCTASKMLNIFRQMELEEESQDSRPPKQLTPERNGQEAKAAQLRSKFENWDFEGVQRTPSTVKLLEDDAGESQIESTKSLSAKFESLRDESNVYRSRQMIKVNRFV